MQKKPNTTFLFEILTRDIIQFAIILRTDRRLRNYLALTKQIFVIYRGGTAGPFTFRTTYNVEREQQHTTRDSTWRN